MPAGVLTPISKRCAMPAIMALFVLAALALPGAADASILAPWGSDLSATPTLDTANGDYGHTSAGPATWVAPNPHSAEDLGVWNTQNTAPQGGQVLQIRVKGCAVEDTSAPTQLSPDGTGGAVPVSTIVFQTLSPQGANWVSTATAGTFQMPFCNSVDAAGNKVTSSYVSTFTPVHMCIAAGDQVAFHDIGGFIPNGTNGDNAGPWYPQGVPMRVIAPGRGTTLDSFVGVGTSTYGPGLYGPGDNTPQSGYAANGNEQVELQVIEGVGDDAYGLCPGGVAEEPANSNTVTCVERHTNPGEPYGTCDRNGNPLFPPANASRPTLSGTPQQGQRLVEAHGSWTNSPYGYRVQWVDCDTAGANCTPIPGATYQFYYPGPGDVGHTLEVQEWASNDANTEGPASTAPTPVIVSDAAPAPLGFGAPQISGLWLKFSGRAMTVNYTDNQFATATLRVLGSVPGVKRGRSCVVAPKKLHPRAKKRCQAQVVIKQLTHQDRAGSNGVKLNGIKPGHYVVEIKAQIGGQVGQPAIRPFVARDVQPKGHAARRRH